ncbi:MAG: hypothetical protein ACKPDI_06945 [Actinomycetota bacterium]
MMRRFARQVRLGPYVFGNVCFEVHAPAAVGDDVRRWFRDGEVTARRRADMRLRVRAEGPGTFGLRCDRRPWITPVAIDDLGYSIVSLVDEAAAARWAVDGLALHAAVIERNGIAAALVGYSGVGKSTLAAAAVRAGYRYVADELALIDEAGDVHAYHRPLGMRRPRPPIGPDGRPAPDTSVVELMPAGSVGQLTSRARLVLLVLIDAEPNREAAAVHPLPPAEAMASLLNNLPGADGREAALFHRVHSLVKRVEVVRLSRGPLEAMIGRLDECLTEVGERSSWTTTTPTD